MSPIISVKDWFLLKKKYLTVNEANRIKINIQSDSMLPVFKIGEIVKIKACLPMKIKVDDIIVYFHSEVKATIHRVVSKFKIASKYYFRTKGDNNTCMDAYLVCEDDIIGVADI